MRTFPSLFPKALWFSPTHLFCVVIRKYIAHMLQLYTAQQYFVACLLCLQCLLNHLGEERRREVLARFLMGCGRAPGTGPRSGGWGHLHAIFKGE